MNTNWIDFLKANKVTISNDMERQFPASQQVTGDSITAILHLGVIKVTGIDSAKFLQGQLTCNINELTGKNSFFSAFCNAKGKVISTLLIVKVADSFLLIIPAELMDKVIKKLQMYVLRSDVNLQNVSEELCLLGLISSDTTLLSSMPTENFAVTNEASTIIKFPSNSLRYLIISPIEQAMSLWMKLTQQHQVNVLASSIWRYLDISTGIPWLTEQSSEGYIPQMLNIDDLGGISFNKGCYTGQEIVARTHYLGKAKRKMFLVECSKTAMLDANTQIISEEIEAPFGKVLSIQKNENKLRFLIILPSLNVGLKQLVLNNPYQDKIQVIDFQ